MAYVGEEVLKTLFCLTYSYCETQWVLNSYGIIVKLITGT